MTKRYANSKLFISRLVNFAEFDKSFTLFQTLNNRQMQLMTFGDTYKEGTIHDVLNKVLDDYMLDAELEKSEREAKQRQRDEARVNANNEDDDGNVSDCYSQLSDTRAPKVVRKLSVSKY